ncbi:MAG: glycosyltransferase [Nitrososphaeria archaeon]
MIITLIYFAVELALISFGVYWSLITGLGFIDLYRSRKSKPDPVDDPVGLSIIIPAKNEERTLERAVESILRADYPKNKLEIIIVEDGSTDRTLNVAKELESRYGGLVKVYSLTSNKERKAGALNFGIKVSRFDNLVFVDADAVIDRDYLIKASNAMKKYDVATGLTGVNAVKHNWLTFMNELESDVMNYIIAGSYKLGLPPPINGYSLVIKKSLLDRVGAFKNSITEDIDLWARLVFNKIKIGYFRSKVHVMPPLTLREFFVQRLRWYKGYVDALSEHFKMPTNRKVLHMELYLAMPIFGATSLIFTVGSSMLKMMYLAFNALGLIVNFVGTALLIMAYLKYREKHGSGSYIKYSLLGYPYVLLMLLTSAAAMLAKVLGIKISWIRKSR